MNLARTESFVVFANGKNGDLLGGIKMATVIDHKAWKIDYTIKRPGIYAFYMEPEPYWEPAENVFIIHCTKTVVTPFGDDEGWDKQLGLKTEIVHLSKPNGLYAGSVFQVLVKPEGKPVPYAEVEIEYYSKDKKATAPPTIWSLKPSKPTRTACSAMRRRYLGGG